MRLPEEIFTKFVKLLSKFQGTILSQFSSAVVPIVESIFQGTTLHLTGRFAIEIIHPQQILELPKGSPQLLDLLTRGANTTVTDAILPLEHSI